MIPWLPAVATGGGVTSGGKAGSTTAMAAKGSGMRLHRGQSVVTGVGGSCCLGSTHFDDASFLIVDATPAEAQVFLDGRLLGTAAEVMARALPLAPGRHTAHVIASGFTPYVARFAADPGFSTIAPEDQEKVFEEFRQVGTCSEEDRGHGAGAYLMPKVCGTPRRADLGEESGGCGLDVHVHAAGASWRMN